MRSAGTMDEIALSGLLVVDLTVGVDGLRTDQFPLYEEGHDQIVNITVAP